MDFFYFPRRIHRLFTSSRRIATHCSIYLCPPEAKRSLRTFRRRRTTWVLSLTNSTVWWNVKEHATAFQLALDSTASRWNRCYQTVEQARSRRVNKAPSQAHRVDAKVQCLMPHQIRAVHKMLPRPHLNLALRVSKELENDLNIVFLSKGNIRITIFFETIYFPFQIIF